MSHSRAEPGTSQGPFQASAVRVGHAMHHLSLDSPFLPPYVVGVSGGGREEGRGSALQNQVFCPPLSLCPLPSSTPPRPLRHRRRSSLLARKPEIGWMHYVRFDPPRARFSPTSIRITRFGLSLSSRAPTHHPGQRQIDRRRRLGEEEVYLRRLME